VENALVKTLSRMEQEEKDQIRCYGQTQAEIMKAFSFEMRFNQSALMSLMSRLSDVQELVERGRAEEARQEINQVKFLMHEACEINVKEAKS